MKRIFSIIGILTLIVSASSCYKNPKHGIARIIVIDGNTKLRVPNAIVKLHQKDVNETLMTDAYGLAIYSTEGSVLEEVPVEQVLNCDASKAGKLGSGIVKVKPNQTITEVISIY